MVLSCDAVRLEPVCHHEVCIIDVALQGRSSEAEEAYREALQTLPGNANIHNNYAELLAAQGEKRLDLEILIF